MKLAIAGECVNGSGAGRVWRTNNRRRRLATGTQRIAGPQPTSLCDGRIIEMLFPEDLSGVHVDGIEIIRNAGFDRDLLGTARGLDPSDDERREQRVHLPRLIVELEFPENLQILNVILCQDMLVPLPGVPPWAAAIGQPVRPPRKSATERSDQAKARSDQTKACSNQAKVCCDQKIASNN